MKMVKGAVALRLVMGSCYAPSRGAENVKNDSLPVSGAAPTCILILFPDAVY